MKNALKKLGIFVLATIALTGCDKSKDKVTVAPDALSELQDEAVLAKIGPFELTKKGRADYATLRVAFYELMDKGSPSAEKKEEKDKSRAKVRASALKAALPYFIQNSVILQASQEYRQTHGDYTEEEQKNVGKWLEKQYLSQEIKGVKSFKSLKNRLDKKGIGEAFEKQIAYEKEAELFLRFACSNRYPIAEYVIGNVYRHWEANDHLASLTNAAILATASNVVAQIRNGEDFGGLADKYSMDDQRNGGGYLGTCTIQDFPSEEELWQAVKDLPEGASTGILDADDSWQILKVLNRIEEDAAELKLELARIYFRRAYQPEKPTREMIVEALENERRNQLVKEIMAERLPTVKIEFPHGREIFGSLEPVQGMLDVIDGKATNILKQVGSQMK